MLDKSNLPLNLREKSNSRISLASSVAVLVCLFFLLRFLDYSMIRKPAADAAEAARAEQEALELEATTPHVSQATVLAVGDNLYHAHLYESGESDSGEWNYDAIYENVLDEIQAADVAMIDQETVFTSDHDSVSTYPLFATPTEVGDAIIKAGFDVIESATNHIDDFGYDFMMQTFDFWKTKYPDIPVLGIHETQEDADTIKTLEVNGITIAFLDYAYGTNTSSLDDDYSYMINIFDQDQIASDVKKAKAISDCIIFVAHWGNEDEPYPSEYEKEWATFLLKQGVDVVIGGHPHVLQPYGRMSDDEGNEMVIFYSLGNFVSTQQELPELLGGMAKFTIEKTTLNGETTVQILDPTVDPTVMHYEYDTNTYQVYMLEDYTEELASRHSVREQIGDEFTLENLKAKYEQTMNMNVEPSEKTYLLNVRFSWDGSMIDKTTGETVYDNDSIHYWDYYNQLYSEE